MYGVPENLQLASFVGCTVSLVCISPTQVQIHFESNHYIDIEGGWQLIDLTGEVIGGRGRGQADPESRGELLLGERVRGSLVSAPESFELHFESGRVLRVFDDSAQHESFSIQPGDIFA